MTFQISATAPTAYQLNSLRAFNLDTKQNGNGSISGTLDFESEDEAKKYLKNRAAMYNDGDPEGTEEKLATMYDRIEKFGSLTLDAVTAHINEVEN